MINTPVGTKVGDPVGASVYFSTNVVDVVCVVLPADARIGLPLLALSTTACASSTLTDNG